MQPTPASHAAHGGQFVKARTVSYVESGGALVVPVPFTADTADTNSTNSGNTERALRRLFNTIHGLWLPGGSHSLVAGGNTTYVVSAKVLIDAALNDGAFPIGGNCLGL
jgi:hypothetical protein